ncbi:hypothetical protein COJ96_10900 [Bacillus sp. AFS073361]|uniref:hypothetical protein n=1 Tax=Bacillus sp. AFS073361 TaxID=2033511 RepID=UPI000BF35C06|nr:hypothetical protein [Bacillus sp. AFS073361]PFP29404.1 hypothetical protein COJ96_10900 [Bacillus sp. AFS073361]
MAKKSESTEQKVQTQAKKNPIPENVELPKEEQTAVDEIQAAPTGTGKSYRLKNPETQYTDPDSGWTLAADQSKPLPEKLAAETLERIKRGFLVEGSGEE